MTDGDNPPYRVRLFGALTIDTPAGLPVTLRGRKARALLAYLILAGGETVSREVLAGLLWSERGEEQARASLRQTLYELRLPGATTSLPVIFDRASARAAIAGIHTDLDQLRELGETSDAAALARLIGDHPRPLLGDLDGVDPGFDEWLAAERGRRGDERRGIVLAVADRALVAGDGAGAHRLATSLLAADPVDEVATRVAMAASHLGGDRHGIRQGFSRLELALRRDLAAAPAAETTALYRRLMSSWPAGFPAHAEPVDDAIVAPIAPGPANDAAVIANGPPPPPLKITRPQTFGRTLALCTAALLGAVAVAAAWPWLNGGGGRRVLLVEPLQVAAGDGPAKALKDGLSTDLARMIVGNGATLSVADGQAPGKARSGDLIVTGDAESSDGMLHANIRLVDNNATIFWSHGFSRTGVEVDALLQEMASKIADVTLCALGKRTSPTGNLDLETTRLFLAACEQKHGDWEESTKLLKQVVARRPDFAHGWAMLAAGTATVADERGGEPGALGREATIYAGRALALDPSEGEAYYARAEVLPGIGNWGRRMDILQAGHSVDPTNAVINGTIAWNLAIVGRSREAVDYARQAVEFDPFSPLQATELARLLGFGEDGAEAADILRVARQRFPLDPDINQAEFSLTALTGDPHTAMRLLKKVGGPIQSPGGLALWQRIIAARIDPSATNVADAARAISASAGDPGRRGLGTVEKLVAMGRIEDAYAAAARLDPEDFAQTDTDKLFSAMMKPFRADRRFMAVAARTGPAQIWLKTGIWPDFCSEKALPYDCRLEARKALAGDREAKPIVAG